MNTAKLNDWLTVVTNIGVIAGLVLLAYEIAQTNETMERDALVAAAEFGERVNARWDSFQNWIVENDDVADIWVRGGAGEELSPAERERFRYVAEGLFFNVSFLARNLELTNPGDISDAGRLLAYHMRGKPALATYFEVWSKEFPKSSSLLSKAVQAENNERQDLGISE